MSAFVVNRSVFKQYLTRHVIGVTLRSIVPIRDDIRQTRPFPSPGQEAVVALLRTADVMGRFVDTVIEPYGITGQQYNVLRILRGAGEQGLPTLAIAEPMIDE